MKHVVSTALATLICGAAFAEPIKLTPADPQPEGLNPGLAVSYTYDAGGRTLEEAQAKLKRATPGAPIAGFSYLDSDEGDKTLTSDEAFKVAAAISGYIRFDAAGTFDVEFLSNDGLLANVGGQQVVLIDGVHGCDTGGVQQVEVPAAGWYALEATYFQRKGSACLLMDWNVSGEMEPVPDDVFGH
ncbi:MAG: hypothetical protein WBB25_12880 [Sulfitobacter sp.]